MKALLSKASLAVVLAVLGLAGPGSTTAKAHDCDGPQRRGGFYPQRGGSVSFGYNSPGFAVGFAKGYGVGNQGYGYDYDYGYGPGAAFRRGGHHGGGHCPPPRPVPPPCGYPYSPYGNGGVRIDAWSTSAAPYGPAYPW